VPACSIDAAVPLIEQPARQQQVGMCIFLLPACHTISYMSIFLIIVSSCCLLTAGGYYMNCAMIDSAFQARSVFGDTSPSSLFCNQANLLLLSTPYLILM
jgi:hypothetical protein